MRSDVELVAPEVSVTGDEMDRLTPDGAVPTQTGVIVTEELKPFSEVRDIGMDKSWPCDTATEVEEDSVKSGIAEVVLVTCAGAVTVNVVEPESPIGLPMTVIVYELNDTLLTAKEAVKTPLEIEHDGVLTGVPESEQLESLVENPVPETCTLALAEADAGLSVMVGGEVRTEKYTDV